MSFIEAVTSVAVNFLNFSGRARRSEYWYFFLFNFVVQLLLRRSSLIFDILLPTKMALGLARVLVSIYSLIVFLPALAVLVRRLHDTGKSGWYLLWNLLPGIGTLIVVIRLLRDGDPGMNSYGPDPKGVFSF
ncbi:MAG: DUF805 domain-containing protein [Oscillospiraceae bacterium]|nr:DUF805 domain-containing protein [Oscillospiraceae bacterium]